MRRQGIYNNLEGKNILFVSPAFFNYEKRIVEEIESRGANVFFYNDAPSNKTLDKIRIRINPKLAANKIKIHYEKIVEEVSNELIDYVFFIKCEAPLEKQLIQMKTQFSHATFILYMYDSIKNIKFYTMKRKYFDHIFSFDSIDVNSNPEMKLRPLFYLPEYESDKVDLGGNEYVLSFIGSQHSDRAKIINHLKKDLIRNNKAYYFKLYFPSKFVYTIKSLLSSDIRELKRDGIVTFDKIDAKEISDIFDHSDFVLDIQHSKQTGLTMRTIELLGQNKRILTTNREIKNYDFYNDRNIQVIERENIKVDFEKMMHPYERIDKDIKENYKLKSWVDEIFGGTEK